MDPQHKKHKSEDLEVTGVSRSGRVRKKSSKLTDFESPDDLDNRHKRSTPRKLSESQDPLLLSPKQSKIYQTQKSEVYIKEEPEVMLKDDIDYENDSYNDLESQNDSSMDSNQSSDGEDDYDDEQEGFRRLDEHTDNENTSQNLYLMERTSNKKRLVIKDGKIVGDTGRKFKRKDKEQVQRQRSSSNLNSPASSNFAHSAKGKTPNVTPSKSRPLSPNEVATPKGKGSGDVALYKVTGTQPIDVAAHLELLGESLRIIGERLKEHEGQIAVSGSLSVLLDSLLCALGPLMCLTQQVPELNSCPPEQLAKTLDNIAYIMPGL